MSDTVWIALIVAGSIVLIFFALLIFLPRSVDGLSRRVQKFDANSKGISINFFQEQAEKVKELKGGDLPKLPTEVDWSEVNILWVDDFPENNFHEASMFEALGAAVRFVRSNIAAVEALQEWPVSIIISDINRHGQVETGLQLPNKIREASKLVPPFIYYVGERTGQTTPSGATVTVYPVELFSEVNKILRGNK